MDPTVEATALEVLVFPIFWGMLGSCSLGATALLIVKAIEGFASRIGRKPSTLHESSGIGLEQVAVGHRVRGV